MIFYETDPKTGLGPRCLHPDHIKWLFESSFTPNRQRATSALSFLRGCEHSLEAVFSLRSRQTNHSLSELLMLGRSRPRTVPRAHCVTRWVECPPRPCKKRELTRCRLLRGCGTLHAWIQNIFRGFSARRSGGRHRPNRH